MNSFKPLGLPEHLLRSVRDLGFETPTPIQVGVIPVVAAGRDVAAEAETGSGKTAAFVLPILQRLGEEPIDGRPVVRVLTLAPTRELALQVGRVFKRLSARAPRPIRVLDLIGGVPVDDQLAALERGVEIVVATPGRLLDLIRRGSLDLATLRVLVLDEADKLLDLGFGDEIRELTQAIPLERQTLLFSATLPQRVVDLASALLRDPVAIRLDDSPAGPAGITQRVFEVERDQRRLLLQHLLESEGWSRALVFVATRRACENLSAKLTKAGFPAAPLHGRMTQEERIATFAEFKRGRFTALVATDIAARGIDISRLGVVVNFDLPRSPNDYLHRIGRTGRAGNAGIAISFVDHSTEQHFRLIEKRSQVRLPRENVAGFELTSPEPKRQKGPPPVKGKRMSKKDRLRQRAAEAAARAAAPESDD